MPEPIPDEGVEMPQLPLLEAAAVSAQVDLKPTWRGWICTASTSSPHCRCRDTGGPSRCRMIFQANPNGWRRWPRQIAGSPVIKPVFRLIIMQIAEILLFLCRDSPYIAAS